MQKFTLQFVHSIPQLKCNTLAKIDAIGDEIYTVFQHQFPRAMVRMLVMGHAALPSSAPRG